MAAIPRRSSPTRRSPKTISSWCPRSSNDGPAPPLLASRALTELTRLSLAAARKGLKDKQFSATELTDAYLEAIERANPKLNAYVAVTADAARVSAKASDGKLASGQGGALEGIPLGIKDLF